MSARMHPWRLIGVALVATVLAAAAAAPPATGRSLPMRALSDTRAVPTRAEALTELRAMRRYACPRGRTGSARRMGKAKAVKSAQRFLRKRVRKRGYARFLRSARARKPAVAENLAAAAVAGRSPAAALAGFLAAHARERRNPRHLLNASVMLTRLGKAREALALIAAAERMPKPRRMPMGIGLRALALNDRGFALIALRRYRQAERPLARAVRLEPLLAEAKLNLAGARLCRGQVSRAVAPYIAGKRRRAFSGGVNTAAVQPRVGDALDLSFRKDGTLPAIRLPVTPDDGVASAAGWKQAEVQRYAETDSLYQQANSALIAMSSDLASKPMLQQQRSLEILALYNERDRHRPDLKAKRDTILKTQARVGDIYQAWQADYQQLVSDCQDVPDTTSEQIEACIRSECPSVTASAHSRWLQVMKEAERLTREWANELHRYATGLAANYSNPRAQQALVIHARHQIMAVYAGQVVLQISFWTDAEDTLKDECASPGGEPQGETGSADLPFPGLCPPGLETIKFAFSIGFASFGVNCEAVSVEASLPEPISPFVQVNYQFAGGSTTIFAGAKAGGKLPGIEASARAGVYMSFNSRGEPTDCGLRGQASAGGESLPGLDNAPSVGGKADYSLAGTFL